MNQAALLTGSPQDSEQDARPIGHPLQQTLARSFEKLFHDYFFPKRHIFHLDEENKGQRHGDTTKDPYNSS